jgi:hypothetical protein
MASNSVITLVSTALTASNTSEKQSISSSTDSFLGWIDVSVNDGATTVAAKLQHSPDGTNWVDLVAFTNVVNTTGTEVKAITGSVFGHVRSVVTLTGTPSATVKVQLWFDAHK